MKYKKVITVVGARPQFIKCAIVSAKLVNKVNEIIIHTGQHYDKNMSQSFFKELKIPKPKYNLKMGGESNTKMTANIMLKLERIFNREHPNVILAYGDTDSTLAAALVASKLYIPLIHVEAGERIYQKKYVPEETNRVIADHLSEINLCSSRDAIERLRIEGLNNAYFVGDPMFDLYMLNKQRIKSQAIILSKKYSLHEDFILVTIHRLENTINRKRLLNIVKGLLNTNKKIIWPVHPRTKAIIEKSKDFKFMLQNKNVELLEPLSYIDLNALISNAFCVLTDSGGVIRESYFAGKFSIVPLKNSWWKNIVRTGWSLEVNDNSKLISKTILNLKTMKHKPRPKLFGDGNSSAKIAYYITKNANIK